MVRVRKTKDRSGTNSSDKRISATKDSDISLVERLEGIANDDTIPATARNAAIRTLLELRGQIGRNSARPEDRTAQVLLSDATRDDLERELSRVRAMIAAQDMTELFGTSNG